MLNSRTIFVHFIHFLCFTPPFKIITSFSFFVCCCCCCCYCCRCSLVWIAHELCNDLYITSATNSLQKSIFFSMVFGASEVSDLVFFCKNNWLISTIGHFNTQNTTPNSISTIWKNNSPPQAHSQGKTQFYVEQRLKEKSKMHFTKLSQTGVHQYTHKLRARAR